MNQLQRMDNTILLSQLGGGGFNPNFITPNMKYADQSQINHLSRHGFGLDMSNILAGLSENIGDQSGLIGKADMSKFFAKGGDQSVLSYSNIQ